MKFLAVTVAAMLSAAEFAQAISVKLTVEERVGVARVAEPVTSGVPLPKGALKDAAGLVLLDAAGANVPAQFTVANRWWEDGSIKWLHVYFSASLAAGASAEYRLTDEVGGGKQLAASPRLRVDETPAGLAVDTGPLRFQLRREGFRLFENVTLNGSPVFERAGSSTAPEHGFSLTIGGERYSPAFDKSAEIVIEEQGPLKAVILVKGRNVKADGAGYGMDFKCRLYVFAGSSRVKMLYTVENRRGKLAEYAAVSDWRLTLPALAGGGKSYSFGLADKPVLGRLGGTVRLDVPHTDVYEFSGAADNLSGNPHAEEPPWIGALDVRGGVGGMTVGVRDFWQMWSKSLEVSSAGSVTVGLWTDRAYHKGETSLVDAQGCAQFFAGIARTHELWFNFRGGEAGDPFAAVAPIRDGLFARCEPAWYCQGTRVFGDLSEDDAEVYLPEWQERVAGLGKWAGATVRRPLQRWRTARTKNGKIDSYGLLSWGDGVEEITGDRPQDVHWEGGYYDYPHSILLNFARTSDIFYLRAAEFMSSHNADVHHTHHDEFPGRSRYCPSYEHIRMDSAGRPAYASTTFNHWKNLSAFERWYLLGDHRAREAAVETLKFLLAAGNDRMSFGQPRSIHHGLYGAWAGYDATGDKRYLDKMATFAKHVAAKIDKGEKMRSGAWQRGMAIQGMCFYVEQTGDESVVPAIRTMLERDFDAGALELAYGMAFMWKLTGEERYFGKAARFIREGRVQKWMQRFGNEGRSVLYMPTLVRKDAARKPPAK